MRDSIGRSSIARYNTSRWRTFGLWDYIKAIGFWGGSIVLAIFGLLY